ncbi:hypothetical protein PVAND_005865 [Polypedilum vanderplanki]|uniref:Transmembrane protein 60 n=1 Tax=Polypedilum vanderplanki TaxID=319348 RepID=A0A9J6C1X4_POLVA|nr:hypothetical protein PVAND_005865 [Polypedilum vanderplanki]
MGFIQRALFTWFTTVVFLILLCLRLEQKINWSFFLIFFPCWLYDLVLIIWVVLELIKRHQNYRVIDSLRRYQYYIYGILLKICSQISICLKLDYDIFKLYIMMIPIWILLVQLIVYVSLNLIPNKQIASSNRSHHSGRMPLANASSS